MRRLRTYNVLRLIPGLLFSLVIWNLMILGTEHAAAGAWYNPLIWKAGDYVCLGWIFGVIAFMVMELNNYSRWPCLLCIGLPVVLYLGIVEEAISSLYLGIFATGGFLNWFLARSQLAHGFAYRFATK